MENWRFIEENPDYMISDHGRVLSFKGRSKLILCAKIMGTGYETVILPNKGVCIEYKIHRLVAKAFCPRPVPPQGRGCSSGGGIRSLPSGPALFPGRTPGPARRPPPGGSNRGSICRWPGCPAAATTPSAAGSAG